RVDLRRLDRRSARVDLRRLDRRSARVDLRRLDPAPPWWPRRYRGHQGLRPLHARAGSPDAPHLRPPVRAPRPEPPAQRRLVGPADILGGYLGLMSEHRASPAGTPAGYSASIRGGPALSRSSA